MCVVRMWEVACASSFHHGWMESRELLWRMYASNLHVPDLYEAWALLAFTFMTVRVIRKELFIKVKRMEDTMDRDASGQLGHWRQFAELATNLQASVSELTVQGI